MFINGTVKFLEYKFEWLTLFIAICSAGLSLFADLHSTECTTWFSRSGAIVVLLSVIVEFRLLPYVYDDIHTASIKSTRKKGFQISDNSFVQAAVEAKQIVKPEVPKSRKILSICAHILVILGTFIWGYGDIWVS